MRKGFGFARVASGVPAIFCLLILCLSAPRAAARPSSRAHAGGSFAIDESALGEVVGRHLDMDTVADHGADAEAPHLAGRVDDHAMIVVQADAEPAIGQDL